MTYLSLEIQDPTPGDHTRSLLISELGTNETARTLSADGLRCGLGSTLLRIFCGLHFLIRFGFRFLRRIFASISFIASGREIRFLCGIIALEREFHASLLFNIALRNIGIIEIQELTGSISHHIVILDRPMRM